MVVDVQRVRLGFLLISAMMVYSSFSTAAVGSTTDTLSMPLGT